MHYAGVAFRFIAVVIDAIVLFVVVVVLGLLAGGAYSTTEDGAHAVGVNVEGWWPVLVYLAYYVGSEALAGKTIGKHAVGLRVVDESGSPIGLVQAVKRNLLRIVDVFGLVAAIAVWSSPKRQRIGDRVAGTLVVHDRAERRDAGLRPRRPAYDPPERAPVDESMVYARSASSRTWPVPDARPIRHR